MLLLLKDKCKLWLVEIMETLKYKIGFLVVCLFIGFIIYINSGNSKKDIDPKELALSNISRIELTRISDEKKIIIEDSIDFGSLIAEFIKSDRTTINNPKGQTGEYYMKIYFHNNTSELVGLSSSKQEGNSFFYKSSQFRNENLFKKLDSIYHTK